MADYMDYDLDAANIAAAQVRALSFAAAAAPWHPLSRHERAPAHCGRERRRASDSRMRVPEIEPESAFLRRNMRLFAHMVDRWRLLYF